MKGKRDLERAGHEAAEVLRPVARDFDRAQLPLMQESTLDRASAFSGVFERIHGDDRKSLAKLRSQPTWLRRAIALGVLAVIVMIAGPLSPRPDISSYPVLRMVLHVGALLGLGTLCVWVALKPLQVPAWSAAKSWSAIALATLSTLTLIVLPEIESAAVGSTGGCFAYGTLLSIPLFGLVRALDRGATLSAVLAGAAGGLAGNVALQLHCPVTDRGHLLVGHFSVLVLFVLLGVGTWASKRYGKMG